MVSGLYIYRLYTLVIVLVKFHNASGPGSARERGIANNFQIAYAVNGRLIKNVQRDDHLKHYNDRA